MHSGTVVGPGSGVTPPIGQSAVLSVPFIDRVGRLGKEKGTSIVPTTDGGPRRIRTHSNNTTSPPPSPPELRSLSPLPPRPACQPAIAITKFPPFARTHFPSTPPSSILPVSSFLAGSGKTKPTSQEGKYHRAPVRDPFLASSNTLILSRGLPDGLRGYRHKTGLPRNTRDAHFLCEHSSKRISRTRFASLE